MNVILHNRGRSGRPQSLKLQTIYKNKLVTKVARNNDDGVFEVDLCTNNLFMAPLRTNCNWWATRRISEVEQIQAGKRMRGKVTDVIQVRLEHEEQAAAQVDTYHCRL